MKKPVGVVAAAVLVAAIAGGSTVLAKGGGHAPEIRIPEVREPREVKVPQIRVPEVRVPEVKVPALPPAPPSNGAALRTPPSAAGPSRNSTASSAAAARPEGNAPPDVVANRSFDSRTAFLESAVATRLGPGTDGRQSVKLLADYRKGGVHCRDYQQTVVIDRHSVRAVGTVCQGRDGQWGLVPFAQRPPRRAAAGVNASNAH